MYFLKGNCGTVFLDAVIKEALRLHPLGPILAREVQQQCEIGGFLIPENTPMIVNGSNCVERPVHVCAREVFVEDVWPGAALGTVIVATAVAILVHGFDWNIEGGVDMV
ncbi:hypothetical protein HID58_019072 [Brassica napus]|uniref:Uncharacterized protein n=1 Tax=Brassica napus TaxID=3708 RepID=A0ABQ8DBT4_BRANA|nr:hypothetical protein HID58_019072 [Brassica napus]